LEAQVKSTIQNGEVAVTSAQLTELEPAAQSLVLGVLATGGDFPIVLVGDAVACVGQLDVPAIADAAKSQIA
jgi:hypothetical protein